MLYYKSEAGDIIEAQCLQEAKRTALRHGAGKILGPLTDKQNQRRLRLEALFNGLAATRRKVYE